MKLGEINKLSLVLSKTWILLYRVANIFQFLLPLANQIWNEHYQIQMLIVFIQNIRFRTTNARHPTLLKYGDPQRENTCSRNKVCYRISFKNLSMDVKFYLSKFYEICCIYLYHTASWSQFSLLSLLWWDDRLVNPSDSSCLIMTDQMILNCIILQMGGICGQQTINICNICGQPGQHFKLFLSRQLRTSAQIWNSGVVVRNPWRADGTEQNRLGDRI